MIKSGEIFMVSRGEWSDCLVIGVCRALKDFDFFQELEDFHADNPELEAWGFFNHLVCNGFADHLEADDYNVVSMGPICEVYYNRVERIFSISRRDVEKT